MKLLTLEGRVIADGLQFPEGPLAMPDGSILVVEIKAERLTRYGPDGRTLKVIPISGGPNGLAIGPDGKCYVCNNGGFNWIVAEDGHIRVHGRGDAYTGGSIQRVDLDSGAVETLYTHCDGHPLCGPNDLVFDAHGGFYFSDLGKHYGRVMDRGAVFYARADGSEIREVAFPVMTPNGVGLSPDDGTLYVTETETCRLWSYPILAPGVVGKEPWPSPHGGSLVGSPGGYQRFDSLAVEACGNICVGTLENGGISVFSPTGELVEFHEAPERMCTNIAFGGPDLTKAYITLSGYGSLIEVDWPRVGLPLHFLGR